MIEINYHIGVNEFNSSENEIQKRQKLPIAGNKKGLPLMIDGMIREDSPLGEYLRKLMKASGYSITFNIAIDVKPMSKSKLKRLRRRHPKTPSRKAVAKEIS